MFELARTTCLLDFCDILVPSPAQSQDTLTSRLVQMSFKYPSTKKSTKVANRCNKTKKYGV